MSNEQVSISFEEYKNLYSPGKQSAERLANSLEPWRFSVTKGPILETGAGAGFFTDYLLKIFPQRKIVINDRSEELIANHRQTFEENGNLEWEVHDIENDTPNEHSYALICGNYVAQIFKNPSITLENLAKSLKSDGLMLMAFPGEDSFKEWRSVCLDLGIPYTGGALPETEPLVIHLSMGPVQVDFYEDQSVHYFDSMQQFLELSRFGGFEPERVNRKLTSRESDLLNKNWKEKKNGKIGLTYHNVFLAVKRVD